MKSNSGAMALLAMSVVALGLLVDPDAVSVAVSEEGPSPIPKKVLEAKKQTPKPENWSFKHSVNSACALLQQRGHRIIASTIEYKPEQGSIACAGARDFLEGRGFTVILV